MNKEDQKTWDYFAGSALQGMLASQDSITGIEFPFSCRVAYDIADDMMKERAKRLPKNHAGVRLESSGGGSVAILPPSDETDERLEVGAIYTTIGGWSCEVVRVRDNGQTYDVIHAHLNETNPYCHKPSGKYFRGDYDTSHDYDIILNSKI